jgi:hypothetical protein
MSRAKSGGGITMNKVSQTTGGRKVEPTPQGVSIGAVSRLGGMVGEGTPKKPLYYNKVAYTTPEGPNHNFEVGPGAGRRVLKSGSQSATPAPRPMGSSRKF